jgi:ubiquinone/menaquinone biosynthesis C-methylase UbiE
MQFRTLTVMNEREIQQRRLTVEQFTKQAVPFAQMPIHNDEDTNRLVIETAGIGPHDTVLDVACGPGLITCAAARIARHVTGIDITPAMIEQARKTQQSMGLMNMNWNVGDALPLPFPESSFSNVITRYSFHHFLEPQKVLTEMVRVCQRGGRVTVVDVFMSTSEQGEAYDRMEKLRDPSHTRAMLLTELTGMFHDAGLRELITAFYRLDVALEKLLTASCTKAEDAQVVRQLLQDDLSVNRMGVGANSQPDGLHFAFPIVVMAGRKPLLSFPITCREALGQGQQVGQPVTIASPPPAYSFPLRC